MFAFDCLVRSSENRCFSGYKDQLLRLLDLNVPACQWLLEYLVVQTGLITDLMLACRDEHVRGGVMELVVLALKKLSVFEADTLLHVQEMALVQADSVSKPLTPLSSPTAHTALPSTVSVPTSPHLCEARQSYRVDFSQRSLHLRSSHSRSGCR